MRTGAITLAALALVACGRDERAGRTTSERGGAVAVERSAPPRCAPDNGGITLPRGFCASVFADSVGSPRHLVVAPNGDVFVALQGARRGDSAAAGVLALRDADGDGRAEVRERFGPIGMTGIGLFDGHLYQELRGGTIVRWPLAAGSLRPSSDRPDTVVTGFPGDGHSSRNFAIGRDGSLYVNVGSRTNACEPQRRQPETPSVDPCTELETRAGIWRYDARRTGQRFSPAERFATGIRNAVGLAINPADGRLWSTQHGRDQLAAFWGKRFPLFTEAYSAENPAELLLQVNRGDDFGWPYCYESRPLGRLVTAPEYGGDGTSSSRCAGKKRPVATFPGHWAPNALAFYTGQAFPAHYRGGAFIAFHGSWNRPEGNHGGYNVVFVPLRDGRAAGEFEVFADGFAGAEKSPGGARYRPTGLAQGPDGSLYVSDDKGGRIWKIVYGR
ncbi:MAG: PQQ-dependent sugar dehydrogenase [Gemmatimonadaceae bacterium]